MKKTDLEYNKIIEKTELYVKELLGNEGTGHDWWHIHRVRKLALKIANNEGGDFFIIEMAALLHDVDDWKLAQQTFPGNNAVNWLHSLSIEKNIYEKILEIIEEVSFKGNGVEDKVTSLESQIVQDADRIDAIGAIGIARAFAYGGSKGRQIYNPTELPKTFNSFEEYKNNKGTTINHFYEKLLILKDRINTPTGKRLAEQRHTFMKKFLEQFFIEWEGKL